MINVVLAIAIMLLLGLLSTRLMKLVGLPNVTGYLIVGLIIGPYALKIITEDVYNQIEILSSIALGFIGFSIGVEFKLSHVKEIGAKAVTITFFQALSATLFVDVVLIATAFFTGMQTYEAIVLGAIATATAPAATLMVVRQYHAKGIVTDTLLPVVALDDAIGLVVFAVSNSIALSLASGSAVTFWNLAVVPVVEILMSLVVGALVGLLLAVVPRFFKSRDNRLIATVFAVFACLGLCTLFEYLEQNYNFPFTLSDLLVCMMAGAVFVNVRKEAAQMMENTDHWTPPILMLFFILSGAELNVATFFGNPKLLICILLYLVARCLGKYLGARLGATITKADPMVRKYLGITLFPQAGVAIGMATMCKQEFTKAGLESVGSGIVTITMCAVMVYELLGPVLTKWALGRAHEIDPKLLSPHKFKAAKATAVADGAVSVENANNADNNANGEVATTTENGASEQTLESNDNTSGGENK